MFSKMFVCFPVKKSEKKTEKCKDTSVAINVKENKKFQEISAPKNQHR